MDQRPMVVHSGSQLQAILGKRRLAGEKIGLVPTMGALHAGHLSLVRASQERRLCTVVTIFVNPTQFDVREDLQQYPRTWHEDLQALQDLQVDFVFAPSAAEMYPEGFSTFVDPPSVARRWEGQQRGAHFRGVATIVLKLLHLAPADWVFFGQKDYQQVLVVRRMIEDLNVPIGLQMCPIVREPDGLAMSSRNQRLDADRRGRALSLFRALGGAAEMIRAGVTQSAEIERGMRQVLEPQVDSVDYAAVVDADTLEPLPVVREPWTVLLAARLGPTRLIDNMTHETLSEFLGPAEPLR